MTVVNDRSLALQNFERASVIVDELDTFGGREGSDVDAFINDVASERRSCRVVDSTLSLLESPNWVAGRFPAIEPRQLEIAFQLNSERNVARHAVEMTVHEVREFVGSRIRASLESRHRRHTWGFTTTARNPSARRASVPRSRDDRRVRKALRGLMGIERDITRRARRNDSC